MPTDTSSSRQSGGTGKKKPGAQRGAAKTAKRSGGGKRAAETGGRRLQGARKKDKGRKKRRRTGLSIFLRVLIILGVVAGVVWVLTQAMNQDSQIHSITQRIAEEVEQRSIPTCEYDNSRFVTAADGTVTYEDENYTVLQGIDVSSHNGEIDWAAVAADGIDYAIVRVGWRGYSEGSLNADSAGAANLDGALENGLQVGAYFYSQAVTPDEAVEEAKEALKVIDGRNLALPVYFDWELPADEEARTSDPDGENLTACALAFCQTIEEAGYEAGVYFYPSLGTDTYNLAQLLDYHLWLSQPDQLPDFPYAFESWQYNCSGQVSGISTNTDRNLWFVQRTE